MKILSLNGGGTAGYATAAFLAYLEDSGGPLNKQFDLIAGVSVGSIIGAAAVEGIPMRDVMLKLEAEIPGIFYKHPWAFWKGITTSKYDVNNLYDACNRIFNGRALNPNNTKFMCHAVLTNPIKPKVWKSWEDNAEYKYICTASAAAPVYFQPFHGYVDGGLACNDPTTMALAEAVKLTGSLSDIKILNVRPHPIRGSAKTKNIRNALHWAIALPMLTIGTNELLSEYESHQLIGFNNHVVDLNVVSQVDTWSPDFAHTCRTLAAEAWYEHQPSIGERFHV